MVPVSDLAAGRVTESKSEAPINRQSAVSLEKQNMGKDFINNDAEIYRLTLIQKPLPFVNEPNASILISNRPVGGIAKRTFDICIALTTLILMAPIMLAIAALIYLTRGRPIFFVQQRVGFSRNSFGCLTISDDGEQRQRTARASSGALPRIGASLG